jgi:TIR domain
VKDSSGHAFISYVREDAVRVDRLQKILEAAGIRVWRDTSDLWPGEDWRINIRRAITKDALAFIACFSTNSQSRQVSGQNEELMLAVDQLRLRRPEQPWLIPVRFDDVALPEIEIGGGRTLNSIQRADLIDDTWDEGAARLVAGVVRALKGQDAPIPTTPPVSIQAQLKAALRDPAGDITLSDQLLSLANQITTQIASDDLLPTTSDSLKGSIEDATLYIADVAETCVDVLSPAVDAIIATAQWVRPDQTPILSRFVERFTRTAEPKAGMAVLLDLQWLPTLPLLYAGGLAALHQSNYRALKAVTIDATVRDVSDGRIPLIGRASPWRPFAHLELVPQVLALRTSGVEVSRQVVEDLRTGRKGNRYTPVSDYLHDTLRERFRSDVPSDADYSDLFDRLEVMLALLAIDLQRQQPADSRVYLDGPHYGRHTWRTRYVRMPDAPESILARELTAMGDRWPPLEGALFGGDKERAASAISIFAEGAKDARSRRW